MKFIVFGSHLLTTQISDEKSFENTLHNIKKTDIIIKRYGYVCKGGGSASGGDWKPKDENSERFKGPPDSIKENSVRTGP